MLFLTGLRQRAFYGLGYSVKDEITADDLRFRTQQVIRKEIDVFYNQLRRNRVDVLAGTASFLDPHRLSVEGMRGRVECFADVIVIATGTSPARSEEVPLDGLSILDSDMFLQIPDLPRSITIVGAGVIGVEYACMTAALGIPTTLISSQVPLRVPTDGLAWQKFSFQDLTPDLLHAGEACPTRCLPR